ncbi:hypothetical protein OESDEN_13084 [Oesophagostomum dentatum]|uniref:Uncharacterized protein n=1 Tax=Oesophagostomum dentatum TaxID=61180 RepID=A0A0B1STG9_OESDE|nr:hypothetical protein OESDEN_13084 [Oesophagostomum dentatum]
MYRTHTFVFYVMYLMAMILCVVSKCTKNTNRKKNEGK